MKFLSCWGHLFGQNSDQCDIRGRQWGQLPPHNSAPNTYFCSGAAKTISDFFV